VVLDEALDMGLRKKCSKRSKSKINQGIKGC
jgi:hypothetical protein